MFEVNIKRGDRDTFHVTPLSFKEVAPGVRFQIKVEISARALISFRLNDFKGTETPEGRGLE